MTPEDVKYYEELFETFSTPGWKHIVEKWQEVRDAKNQVSTIPPGGLEERKGELSMIDWMLSFEASHREHYEVMQDADV